MFRFTIRDVVLLTLVAALALGWWIDRSRLSVINQSLHQLNAEQRLDLLRAKELRGEVILSPMPR